MSDPQLGALKEVLRQIEKELAKVAAQYHELRSQRNVMRSTIDILDTRKRE